MKWDTLNIFPSIFPDCLIWVVKILDGVLSYMLHIFSLLCFCLLKYWIIHLIDLYCILNPAILNKDFRVHTQLYWKIYQNSYCNGCNVVFTCTEAGSIVQFPEFWLLFWRSLYHQLFIPLLPFLFISLSLSLSLCCLSLTLYLPCVNILPHE